MGGVDLRAVIRRLCGAAANPSGGGVDDAELLRRFVASRDEAAFETLVWRHAGLVYGVCRRVLRNAEDAEDAFQATFLVLARKGPAIRTGTAVGGWLYQVACRAALRARAARARRAGVEPLVEDPPAPAADEAAWRDLRTVLDEEISRLPAKYRAPFVLHYLQGLTCREAGRDLGCPAGTVMTRLARGRERLQAGLTRRGVGFPAGLVAAGVLPGLAAANAPPAGLTSAAAEAGLALLTGGHPCAAGPAVLLSDEVIRAMFTNPLKTAVLLAATGLALGAGVTLYSAALVAGDPPVTPDRPTAAAPKPGQTPHGESELPAGAAGRLGSLRLRSPGGMQAAFAPAGKTVVIGGVLWDVRSGERVAEIRLQPREGVGRPTFSPDGKLLVATGWDPRAASPVGFVSVWDAATGRELRRLAPPPTDPRAGRIHDAVFSADGKAVVALADTFVRIKPRSPDEKQPPAPESDPGFVLLTWDAALGKVLTASRVLPGIQVPAGGGAAPMSWGLSPGGKVAGVWVGLSLRLWDVGAGRELPEVPTADYRGGGFAFSPDSKAVYLGDRGLRRWEVESGKATYHLEADRGYTPFSLSQDGALLTTVSRDHVARVRDAATGKELRQFPVSAQGDGGFHGTEPVLSADGKVLATESAGTLCLWDAATGKELFPADGHYGPVAAAAFSPDGRRIASAGWDGRVCVWDRAGRTPPATLARLPFAPVALAFSPKGESIRVLAAERGKMGPVVRFLDAKTGKELRTLAIEGDFDTGPNAPAAFSPDGKLVAGRGQSAHRQPGLVLCSAESGNRVAWRRAASAGTAVGDGPSAWVLAVAFGPDGTLASATADAVTVWNPEGRARRTIALQTDANRGAIPFHPTGLAFSADGRLLIATDPGRRTLRAWEVESGRELPGLAGTLPSNAVSVAAAPDGVSFATGQWDTTLLLWDIPTLLRKLGAEPDPGPPSPERLGALWDDLADGDDAVRALRAVCELAAVPDRAVPFLDTEAEKLVTPPDRLERLIADLDAERFATREKATRELARIGAPAESALRAALKGASAEAAARIKGLLTEIRPDGTPAARRWSRAVQALEYAGTPDARKLLGRIARGPLGGRAAEEARGALDRLTLRPPVADPKRP